MPDNDGAKVVLITGAARRIGAATAHRLHEAGMNIVVHYLGSRSQAGALKAALNEQRPGSAQLVQADLVQTDGLTNLVEQAVSCWGRLDALVNNASSFYPTPVGQVNEGQWDELLGTNLKAPFFLAQAAAPYLAQHHGGIVNIADIHGQKPLQGYAVYSVAKAGLIMLTRSLARELAPNVRVNAVAPGAILWPEHDLDEASRQSILKRIPLGTTGSPDDIADAVRYLICDAAYVTGQVLSVDGGRSLCM
ncbi:MAG: pteridine reductase [Gammaproteobacteria bacterium]|nr:MAG: pteridine reductase [Gammaproteobacteria bacterium]